jgi:hypothetical protein
MDTSKIFQSFIDEIKKVAPELELTLSIDEDVKNIETFYPDVLKILQKDVTFFSDKPRTLFGVDLGKVWERGSTEELWKSLQACMISAFMHGDLNDKIGTVMDMFKSYWAKTGTENAEVNKILNDEKSEGYFKEILEYISKTRIAKMFMDVMENIDVSDLNLNFENPAEIIEMIKNPEHPTIKKITDKIQGIIKGKMQRGELTQQQIVTEVEAIKAKIGSIFGNVFNDAMGFAHGETAPAVLMGNSPEARRQRMLARLQKKQREKTSH